MFDITGMTADADDNVVSISWSYTTDAGSRRGTIKLTEPFGNLPLALLSKATILGWVDTYLPDDVTDQLDAQIEKDNAARQIREVEVPS